MKRLFYPLSVLALLICSCSNDGPIVSTVSQTLCEDNIISKAEAIKNLEDFLCDEPAESRGGITIIGELLDVGQNGTVSRGDQPLLYVANFSEGGFAVLAADRRIADQVIAVPEDGVSICKKLRLFPLMGQIYA